MKKYIALILSLLALFLLAVPVFATELCAHEFQTYVVAPTCAERGYTIYSCPKCGEFYYYDFTEATGHIYGEWEKLSEATCTSEGKEQRICVNCNSAETKTIPVLEHTDANYDGKCDLCGCEMELEEIFSPYDWIKAFFKAVIEWFKAIFA